MKSVSVIGLGYIGLPTATLIANHGFQVYGMDPVENVVNTINEGRIHIVEPFLENYVKKAVESGRLIAATDPHKADVFILAVPTPFKGQKEPDLSYIESASSNIAPFIEEGNLVILESTSPVGTTEKVKEWILKARPDLTSKTLYFSHCPERVLPGRIVQELATNDRIIGGIDEASTDKTAEFYSHFITGSLLKTDSRTAEMSKLTENSFRDVNIAFANELSIICEKLNINVWELISLANRHPRVNILQPGPGVGGHCIAVDPWFIVDSAPDESRLIKTARIVNDDKPSYVIRKVQEAANGFSNPRIACLGLAFKPDIDDLRESPSMAIVQKLSKMSIGQLLVSEPNVKSLPTKLAGFKNIEFMNYTEAIDKADIVLILVDHKEIKALPKDVLKDKIVIDTRGVFA